MTKNIAWIDEEAYLLNPYQLEMEIEYPDSKFTSYTAADIALDELMGTSYDLVVINPVLASGQDYPNYTEPIYDPTKFSIDLIKRIRTQEGPNRDTPIIAIHALPGEDLISKLKEAGVNEVVDTSQCISQKKLYEVAKQYLQ